MKTLRHYAYRYNYIKAANLNHRMPVDVSLELASVCNQRCGYCYHSDQEHLPFTKGMMNLTTAKLIIVDAANHHVPAIKFNWKGESTLNPHFREITEFAKDHANESTFIDRLTNSNFKFAHSRSDIFLGLCNQTKVKVSFDSFNADVMHAQRAGSNHSQAMKNIDIFYNHPKRKDTELVIQAVRTNLNKDEDIKGLVEKRWPGSSVSIRDMVAGRVESKTVDDLENRKRDVDNRQSCIQAHARLIFKWDGTGYPCCVDLSESMPLGNIHDESIWQIFNSMKARELRKALKDKSAFSCGACKTCSSFESYKGFRASWKS